MRIIEGDILNITNGFLCHQVNCQRVMGAGLAKHIKNKWPFIYETYRKADLELGKVVYVAINDNSNVVVTNICGQFYYGKRGQCYTDYKALRKGLREVFWYRNRIHPTLSIYIPYMMGCGLAGGDWNIVTDIINQETPDAIVVQKKEFV
jgi:O-acetyl-ADP-ribose deacetylase (regulator of RNase III)